jgi:hypothetical protein
MPDLQFLPAELKLQIDQCSPSNPGALDLYQYGLVTPRGYLEQLDFLK